MLRLVIAASACLSLILSSRPDQAPTVIEHDSTVAKPEPGPHNGGGQTTAYSFFAQGPQLGLVFRKRALHAGAAIGYHRQDEDEIYYVVSGTGVLTLRSEERRVGKECRSRW